MSRTKQTARKSIDTRNLRLTAKQDFLKAKTKKTSSKSFRRIRKKGIFKLLLIKLIVLLKKNFLLFLNLYK